MIIFDLDTLADDTHRRHFINPILNKDYVKKKVWDNFDENEFNLFASTHYVHKDTGDEFKPDYDAYNAACIDDVVIESVRNVMYDLRKSDDNYVIEIWTSRCESTRSETVRWINNHILWDGSESLKMRPIGNTDPVHVLKEKWLFEFMNSNKWNKIAVTQRKCPLDFVFDADSDSVAMWRRRGVYCFDCRQ